MFSSLLQADELIRKIKEVLHAIQIQKGNSNDQKTFYKINYINDRMCLYLTAKSENTHKWGKYAKLAC